MKMKKVLAAALSLACASTLFAATAVTASAADKKGYADFAMLFMSLQIVFEKDFLQDVRHNL